MKDIKLIALDMDGTLLTSEQEISPLTQNKVKDALAKDVQVVLSTGRWFSSCYPFAETLGLTSNLITVNGGEIWTVDKELKEQHLFDPSLMEQLWEMGAAVDMDSWMVSLDEIWYNSRPDHFQDHDWLKIGFAS
ncbi:MAG TPA: HAD family hydrolase, partial [Bacillota bacterium]|nr:HAD family hydrolase [Bacillota bacterium]